MLVSLSWSRCSLGATKTAVTQRVREMRLLRLGIVLATLSFASTLSAQAAQQGKTKKHKEAPDQVDLTPHEAARIFTAEEPLQFTLTANFGRLRKDKSQQSPWREATITVRDSSDSALVVPLKVKTRGIWRLNNCDFPPIRLDFAKSTVKHTLFAKLDKPKLVTHCRDNNEFEQYLLQEMQLYRIYNLLTPYSHRVRLARVMYVDSANGKPVATRYAFLEEEATALAHRVGGLLVKEKGARASDLEAKAAAIFGVFQYMIGNTDWSIAGLHNVELITSDSLHVPIAYDFDFSGAVNTRYATVDPSLPIKHVRDRLYRGYCLPDETFGPVFDMFKAKKDSIYALYRDPIGKLLDKDRVKETLEYFDDFYDVINDRGLAKRLLLDRCINRP